MNIALGFGSTEQQFERDEEHTIREHIERRYADLELRYFTDDFVAEISDWVKARAKDYQAQGDAYKAAADYPSRYSYYWPTVLADPSHLVVIAKVYHVNRRHAMSADGWALLASQPVFVFHSLEIEGAISKATNTPSSTGESK